MGMKNEAEEWTRQLAAQLSQNGRRICTAESCTGGLIAKTLTDLAGSSNWFERGFVTYSNQAKMDMLGVRESTLKGHGAVSEAVVREMAVGAVLYSEADVAIAVTGIAGPGGGSEIKPVGTVWFGFALGDEVKTKAQVFDGQREQVRSQSLLFALRFTVELLANSN